MKKWWLFIIIAIGLVSISFVFPNILLNIYACLKIDSTLLPAPNYVQSVSSIMSFFVATLISYSVYQLTVQKDKKSKRQDAHELYAFLEETIHNIEMEAKSISLIAISQQTFHVEKLIFNLKLSDDEVSTLKYIFKEFRKIGKEAAGNANIHALCVDFLADKNLTKCKNIMLKLEKK